MRTFKFLKIEKNDGFLNLNNFEPFKVVVPDWVPDNFDKKSVFEEIAGTDYHTKILLINDDFSYRVNWENVKSSWLKDPVDFDGLNDYAHVLGVPCPLFEHLIKEPYQACEYLRFHGMTRYRALEDLISRDEHASLEYLRKMSGNCVGTYNFSDWSLEEVCKSPVWIYHCVKKHGYNEDLYNAMTIFSFSNPDSIWIKKFMNTKRFLPKEMRKKVSSKTELVKNIMEQNNTRNPFYIKTKCENMGVDVSMSTIRKIAYDG